MLARLRNSWHYRTVRGSHVAIALALCATLAAPGAAHAQRRLGTDLATHTPNANFDCRWRPSVVGPQFAGGPDNCTYLGAEPTTQSTGAPGPGVIVRVRVKAAAPVGPMQVTVARAIRSTTAGFACCFYQRESQVFTPQPNATTTIATRLPVSSEFNVQSESESVDYLGLTVLANNVAIPGQYPGNNSLEGSLGFFPRLTPADSISGRVDGYGNSLIPLLNADFVPICPAATGGNAHSAQGRCIGAASFRGGSGSLNGTVAGIPLLCNLTIRCDGRLSLRSLAGKPVGTARFRIPVGARRAVNVKLNRAGKRLVRGKRRVRVKAKASIKGTRPASRKVTLSR
jgi:hypothetical protein